MHTLEDPGAIQAKSEGFHYHSLLKDELIPDKYLHNHLATVSAIVRVCVYAYVCAATS